MEFEKKNTLEYFSSKLGFLLSYCIFTTILYYMLLLLHKIPSNWTILNIAAITFSVTVFGLFLKKLLK
jgi:hypothetical protein